MARRTSRLRKHDARVLLSDVLPYELPPSFSNRGLVDFIRQTQLSASGTKLSARRVNPDTEALIRVIVGGDAEFLDKKMHVEPAAMEGTARRATIPFNFTIRHRENDFRTLTIPHPAAQLEIVEFYAKFDSLLLYHTSKSRFTLRRPARVAPYAIVDDWLFRKEQRGAHDSVEMDGHEYEWLRSYFTYRRYSNVYKFYDSREYRSCERRFGYLVRVDVAKCFDSMYTHSLAWAAHGHEIVKANLGDRVVDRTFGGEFDALMQRLNHNETAGITIGSELSRLFAEIILQAVDLDIESQLRRAGLKFGSDYEILRYVDDYFVFLANAQNRQLVVSTIAKSLRKYKLHLNPAKEKGEYTPWLSPLTVAKDRVVQLLRQAIKRDDKELEAGSLSRPFIDARRLIVGYKAILLDTGVSHFDLANYALSRAERAMEKMIRSARLLNGDAGAVVALTPREITAHNRSMSRAMLALLDFVFFVFSGAPRMSPAVKVARIVSSIVRLTREAGFAAHERERIELRTRDELIQQLRRLRDVDPDPITATLIDCLTDLGPRHCLDEEELANLCGFTREQQEWIPPADFNSLLLFSMILHMGDRADCSGLRSSCESWILDVQSRPRHDAERAIISLNVLSCPWISHRTRVKILRAYGHMDQGAANRLTRPGVKWNVDWREFDLYAALQRKRLFEVY